VAQRDPNRSSISFTCGDTTNACSVIIKDLTNATASNGYPLTVGSCLYLDGEIATHEFSAIRLAALDCVVGVVDGYPDSSNLDIVGSDLPVSGVPSL